MRCPPLRFAAPLVLAAAALLLDGCAGSDTQRYFPPKRATHSETDGAELRVLFVRQSIRELVALVRVSNHGSNALTLSPTGPVASWSVAIAGRTLALADSDRTYWSAWSGTTTREKSPLKVSRDLAPGEKIDIEVRWRFEPALAEAHAPWVLTAANLQRGGTAVAPLSVAFPGPEAGWRDPVETNPNRILRPGQRGYTNTRPWQYHEVDDAE